MSRTKEEIDQVGSIIDLISTLASESRFAAIDDLLQDIDLSLSDLILMSYLRSTFPLRQKLYYWADALNKIKNELDARGLGRSKILHGLI